MQDSMLKAIHSTERRITSVGFFKFKCNVCLLDFVGADQYFITDFGAIWKRRNVFANLFGILNKGYEPVVNKDPIRGYPWVLLHTSAGDMWFPVNQLYGWAFDPQTDIDKKYYVSAYPSLRPMIRNNYKWKSKLSYHPKSLYCQFMKHLYE
jgi:hypothetical protein